MNESSQKVTWVHMKEWLYVRYSLIKTDVGNKSSEVPDVDINRYAADVFQLKDENIEDETTGLMSLIIEDSIVNLSCVFIFLLVNWIDPDGSHFKLFDNG
ncbi:hypothetical protein LINPERPRIM_LOCUS31411 [Linum perenne]